MPDSTASLDGSVNSQMSIKRTGVFIGAEVRGVDLTKPLDQTTVETLRRSHAEYGVLAFPDQKISSEDLMRFGRYFGDLTVHPFSTSSEDQPELIVYDNKEGNPPPPTCVWHTDETFRECPPMGTILCSKIVPDIGGDTTFASMTAVYDGLSARMQAFLSGLEAIHNLGPFRNMFDDTEDGRRKLRMYEDMYPERSQPVVRVHPVTKKKSIFVNPQFTVCIKGMEEEESRAILDLLYRKTLRLEYQYRHRWEPDTVVFWDNRWVQHAAVHDYYPKRRLMERVTVAGDLPKSDAEPADPTDLRRYLMPPLSAFKNRVKRLHE